MSDPRTPTDLQAVFLAAKQGRDVYKPPASKSVFRVFKRAIKAGINRFKVRRDRKAPRSASMSSTSSFPSTVLSDCRDDQPMLQVPLPQAWGVQKVHGLSCELAQTADPGRLEPNEALLFVTSLESASSHDHESVSTFSDDNESDWEAQNWFEDDEGLMEELDELFSKYGRARED